MNHYIDVEPRQSRSHNYALFAARMFQCDALFNKLTLIHNKLFLNLLKIAPLDIIGHLPSITGASPQFHIWVLTHTSSRLRAAFILQT